MTSFTYTAGPARVVFGSGSLVSLAAEVRRLGGSRALLIGGSHRQEAVAPLGSLLVAEFPGAVMHTPVEVTEKALAVARENSVDCLVAVGGGSAIGLSKALAVRTDLPQLVVPTTYAGSEATPVLGETVDGRKTTRSSAAILPETIVYDVDLTLGLPVAMSVTSGINALAHAVEALYSADANPVTDQLALEAIRLLADALPRIVADPADLAARSDALQAAWLAGSCLGSVGMGLHHKLCHTLGGSFGLPHAETHTVVLPHAMAYNASAAPSAMRRIASALGVSDAPTGVYDLVAGLGGPTSLRSLGLTESNLDEAAALAAAKPYPNPRPIVASDIRSLLQDAWSGTRPVGGLPDVRGLLRRRARIRLGRRPSKASP
jgi:maleylacetate reductase